ncbi:MAG: recombinase family protein [Opitutales bacterium]|nr:recombinase family protein [Opitutales bacterium]
MKYIYARVSTEEQNVKQQVQYLADKYEHDAVVSETFTGTTTERPKFRKLLKEVKRGDTIIVYHVSRLGRKTSEVLETVELLLSKSVSVVVDQLEGVDITSGVGKLLFTMLSGLAELEREMMLERQRVGISRAKAEGKYQGRKRIDPEIVQSAKTLLASGMTRQKVADQLGIGVATLYRYCHESMYGDHSEAIALLSDETQLSLFTKFLLSNFENMRSERYDILTQIAKNQLLTHTSMFLLSIFKVAAKLIYQTSAIWPVQKSPEPEGSGLSLISNKVVSTQSGAKETPASFDAGFFA